jgi:hypothetical protein
MSDENKEDSVDQLLADLHAHGGHFPASEELLERLWRRSSPPRTSPLYRARIHALLGAGPETTPRRALGASFASFRQQEGQSPATLARALSVPEASVDDLENGRAHPALFAPAFWRAFATALGIAPRALATFLRTTDELVAGSLTQALLPGWVADIELPADPVEGERVLRTRLAQIVAELEQA